MLLHIPEKKGGKKSLSTRVSGVRAVHDLTWAWLGKADQWHTLMKNSQVSVATAVCIGVIGCHVCPRSVYFSFCHTISCRRQSKHVCLVSPAYKEHVADFNQLQSYRWTSVFAALAAIYTVGLHVGFKSATQHQQAERSSWLRCLHQ